MPEAAYLTVQAVAARLAVTDEQVLALIHSGRLRAVNVSVGRKPRWRIDPADLDLFLSAHVAGRRSATSKPRKKRLTNITEYF